MIQRSDLLSRINGVRHGFSTRQGGTSKGPFAGLNVGRDLGDDPAAVHCNRRELAADLGLSVDTPLIEVDQVHGSRVVVFTAAGGPTERADGLIATRPRLAVGVRTADCAPVLIADVQGRAVAAVHAGWRSATGGIVAEAVRLLEELGIPPADLSFAIGPTIGPDAFQVGPEVVDAARVALGGDDPPARRDPSSEDRWLVDLRGLVTEQIRRLGVADDRIDRVGGCTADDADLYFSHRRDRGRTGRHLSVIAID